MKNKKLKDIKEVFEAFNSVKANEKIKEGFVLIKTKVIKGNRTRGHTVCYILAKY